MACTIPIVPLWLDLMRFESKSRPIVHLSAMMLVWWFLPFIELIMQFFDYMIASSLIHAGSICGLGFLTVIPIIRRGACASRNRTGQDRLLVVMPNWSMSFPCRDNVGIAMIVLSLWSVVTLLLGWIGYLVTAYGLWIKAKHWWDFKMYVEMLNL